MVILDGCLPMVSVYNVELLILNVSPKVLSSREGFKDRIEDAQIIFNHDMQHVSSFSTNSPTLNFQNSVIYLMAQSIILISKFYTLGFYTLGYKRCIQVVPKGNFFFSSINFYNTKSLFGTHLLVA